MALIHVGFFAQSLGMCASCDVILPEASAKLIGMETEAKKGKHQEKRKRKAVKARKKATVKMTAAFLIWFLMHFL